jgi:hypothetical protein
MAGTSGYTEVNTQRLCKGAKQVRSPGCARCWRVFWGVSCNRYAHADLPYWNALHTVVCSLAHWMLVKKVRNLIVLGCWQMSCAP